MLVTGDLAQGGRYAVTLPGMSQFNAGDPAFVVEQFQSWGDGPAPRSVLVANGGGAGAVAVDPWEPGESYYVLNGSIEAIPELHLELRRQLMAAVTSEAESAVQVVDPSGVGLQVFVRVYDRRTIEPLGDVLTFSLPLVAPDPYKYGLTALTAECGAFAPIDWYRIYSEDAGDWYRTYTEDGATNYRTYEQEEEDTSSLPGSAVLVSEGDVASRRLTITVTGPLGAGDWWLEDANGTRLWAEVGLLDGQSVVFDCLNRTATLAGANIDHLVQGDFLAMEPGTNTYRLLVGTSTGGFATFEGLEAYR